MNSRTCQLGDKSCAYHWGSAWFHSCFPRLERRWCDRGDRGVLGPRCIFARARVVVSEFPED